MEIKFKTEYRLLSYIRDNSGVKEDILKMLNVTSLEFGWGPYSRKIYGNLVKNNMITKRGSSCFLTEEGKEELKRYEEIHSFGKRGIIEHRHERERIRFVR